MTKRLLVILFFCCFFLACSTEKEDWTIAENENTIAAYEIYLEQHPQGSNADSANARLEELIWQKAATTNTIESYEEFLTEYPNSSFKDSVISNMEEIELKAKLDVILQNENIDEIKKFVLNNPDTKLLDSYRLKTGVPISLDSQPMEGKKGSKVFLKTSDKADHLDYVLTVPPNSAIDLGFDATITIEKGSMRMAIREGNIAGYYSTDEETTISAEIRNTDPVELNSEFFEIQSEMTIYLSESEFIIAGKDGAVIKRSLTANEFFLDKGEAYYVKF